MKNRIPAAALSLALLASLSSPAAALEVQDARALLEKHYVDPIPAAVLEADTVEEMLRLLNDPYTVYYTAEQYESFLSSINGDSITGVGISISTAYHDGCTLLSILPDSPAQEAGLQAGDTVVAVDGVTLTPQHDAASLISGPEGTSVTLTIRTVDGELKDVTLVRRTVHIPIVSYEQRNSMGYIDCTSFGDTTSDVVRDALTELDDAVAVWVMDLRDNPGGTSDAAAATAGMFLGSEVMVHFRDGQDTYYETKTTALCPDLTDKPLIILTSGRSASASELFSAAIRDHRGGISLGQRTYGKGIAQAVYDEKNRPALFDGDALKITTYRFFSPDGATNHLVGVIPTLLVDPEYTDTIAALLSAPEPERSLHQLKLELCGYTFYLSDQDCKANPEAFTELLEALPPSAKLSSGTGVSYWKDTTPAQVAQEYGLDYQPRTFSDVQGHDDQREIDTLSTYGLLAGGEDGQFHPDEELTRAQLCVLLANAMNFPANDAALTFSDVSPDAWYADAVSAMAARGFLSGTGDGTFSPDATLTRQELLTALSAMAAWCSAEGYQLSQTHVSAVQWAEFYEYPEWAQAAARNLDALGVDVARENPGETVTRAETARLLCQLLENIHVLWNK